MSKFIRKDRLVWADKAQVRQLADELLDLWDGKSLKTTIAKAIVVLEACASGDLKVDGKNIYVLALKKEFLNAGLEIPKDSEGKKTPPESDLSKYA